VGVVKHAHHEFDIDKPGKDSFELRAAGATQMLIASRRRWAMIVERELDGEPSLDEVLRDLDQSSLDLVLVEGFKREQFPKIELHRTALRRPLLCIDDPNIVAVASDGDPGGAGDLPVLDLNEPQSVADYIATEITGTATGSGE
ncbi:MAG: molybdopterin-guanine dinucleotide biosynthesis protein B, partial [Pseudomonadota bacterium]